MSELEKALGRRLEPQAHQSIATLNDITPEMLADLRRLAGRRTLSRGYLEYYVVQSRGELDNFLDEVVEGGKDPLSWGFTDLLVAPREDAKTDPFVISWEHVESVLAPVNGECWFRLPLPRGRVRHPCPDDLAIVGTLARHRAYWWRSPGKTATFNGPFEYVDNTSARIAFRRHIASRASWWAREYLAGEPTQLSVAGVVAAIGIEPTHVSSDARIALSALLRECALPVDPEKSPRGFAGPDAWYASTGS